LPRSGDFFKSGAISPHYITEPIHLGKYFKEQLLDITDNLDITQAVFTITCDNASLNNTMLKEVEASTKEKRLQKDLNLQQP
jgi:hypothetical protein